MPRVWGKDSAAGGIYLWGLSCADATLGGAGAGALAQSIAAEHLRRMQARLDEGSSNVFVSDGCRVGNRQAHARPLRLGRGGLAGRLPQKSVRCLNALFGVAESRAGKVPARLLAAVGPITSIPRRPGAGFPRTWLSSAVRPVFRLGDSQRRFTGVSGGFREGDPI